MPKNDYEKALTRELALTALHNDINDAMKLLKAIQDDFSGVHEALWPLVFTTILNEVRSIRHITENPWPSIGKSFEAKGSSFAAKPEKLESSNG